MLGYQRMRKNLFRTRARLINQAVNPRIYDIAVSDGIED